MFSHLKRINTNSKENLQVSNQQQSYPVVVFSHGAGTSMEVQTSQSEDLASHGYIVVAIDHTYASVATVFPNRIVSHFEATTDFNTAEPAEIITQIMAEDVQFVLEQLGEMNEGKIAPIFQGKLNLNQIGAIGHSVGGAAAYNLAIYDPSVKAAINLDGTVFISPKAGPGAIAPFLMLANDKDHIQAIQSRESLMKKLEDMPDEEQKILISIYGGQEAYQKAYDRAQQNIIGLTEVLEESGNLFTIEGSDHMKFIDIGLFIGFRPLREFIRIGGKTDPEKCLEITKSVTQAFFDQTLKGETNDPLEALVKKYPELKKVDLK
jgi:dienelactone hydrolase